MSTITTDSGHVLAVTADPLGSSLVGTHAAGVTVLTVEDCADFDDTVGGILSMDGVTYAYSGVDDGASTMTISPALAADAEDGSPVALLNPLTGDPTFEWVAQVTLDGIDPGGPLLAGIRSSLVSQLSSSIRGITGEAVALQWDEDETLWVVDILTGSPVDDNGHAVVVGSNLFAVDTLTLTTDGGPQTLALSHLPVSDASCHVYWDGDEQEDWTRDGQTITWDEPAALTGDTLACRYAYKAGAVIDQPVTPDPPDPILIGVKQLFNQQTSIALPAGTQAGDLIVVASMTLSTATTSDPRLTGSHAFGGYAGVWWGTADGSGAPLTVAFNSGGFSEMDATTVAVYRGVTVGRTAFTAGSTTPVTAPVITDAQAAVVAVLGRNNIVTGNLSADSTGAWTPDAFVDDDKAHARIGHWVSAIAADTPAGSWSTPGDVYALDTATLELVTA